MIQVGINNNIVISKLEINKKGSLDITLKESGAKSKGELDIISMFNMMDNSGYVESVDESSTESIIKIFPANLREKYDKSILTPQDVLIRINDIKNPLDHILNSYMPLDRIIWDYKKGTNLNSDNLYQVIMQDNIVNKISSNIFEQFIEQFNKLSEEVKNTPKRILLVRQSVKNHYGTFRSKYLNNYPFMEDMSIPEDATKLKFTAYEIKKGFDNGDPVKDVPDATTSDSSKASIDIANAFSGNVDAINKISADNASKENTTSTEAKKAEVVDTPYNPFANLKAPF